MKKEKWGNFLKKSKAQTENVTPKLKNIFKKILSIGLPIGLTVGLVWYMFTKVPFDQMMEILRGPVDYWWILAAMGLSVVSHVIRAKRWQLQLNPLGIRVSLMDLSCSIFGCYALNLLFPRLGEVWRCTYISRRGQSPFATVLGSLVADRAADAVAVLGMFLIALVVAYNSIEAFMDKYPVGRDLLGIIRNPVWWIVGISGLGIMVGLILLFRRTTLVKKGKVVAKQIWGGFSTVLTMPGRWKFILFTVLLWGCYYIQLYVAFFAFDFTARLCRESSLGYGFIPCLVAFVLSSFGMAIPSNGGLGPWNIAVMFGLALYGISESEGVAFSMLQWSGQTVMLVILGIFTMIYISRPVSKEKKLKNQ